MAHYVSTVLEIVSTVLLDLVLPAEMDLWSLLTAPVEDAHVNVQVVRLPTSLPALLAPNILNFPQELVFLAQADAKNAVQESAPNVILATMSQPQQFPVFQTVFFLVKLVLTTSRHHVYLAIEALW